MNRHDNSEYLQEKRVYQNKISEREKLLYERNAQRLNQVIEEIGIKYNISITDNTFNIVHGKLKEEKIPVEELGRFMEQLVKEKGFQVSDDYKYRIFDIKLTQYSEKSNEVLRKGKLHFCLSKEDAFNFSKVKSLIDKRAQEWAINVPAKTDLKHHGKIRFSGVYPQHILEGIDKIKEPKRELKLELKRSRGMSR